MSGNPSDFTLNKLILLYILREKGCISRSELADFVLYHKYMDYFSLDQYIIELEDSGLLSSAKENNRILYHITRKGCETLNLFQLRIPHSLRREILEDVYKRQGHNLSVCAISSRYESVISPGSRDPSRLRSRCV